MVCEGRGRASEREREGGAINASRSNEVKTPQQVAFPPNKKKELNTCVHVSRGRQGPPPLHEMSTRRHHTISPSLSCPFTHLPLHPHDVCALWFSFGFILDYLSSVWPTQHSVSARLSVCPRVCLFSFLFSVCLPGSWPVQLKAIITYVKKEARIMADMAWPDAIRCEAKRSDALLRDVLKTQWENCGNCGNTATTDQRLSNISLPSLLSFALSPEI